MTTNTLRVLIQDSEAGTLNLQHGRCEFRLLKSYKQAYPRPVLGQQFLDDLEQVHHSRAGSAPAWFSNLIPDAGGALRNRLFTQAGIRSKQDFFLLHYLGEDLPGAVHIVAEDNLVEPDEVEPYPNRHDQPGPLPIRFSLAGMQLKFSALKEGREYILLDHCLGGNSIIKPSSPYLPHVPENEFATMQWAKFSGITVPELELVKVRCVKRLSGLVHDIKDDLVLTVSRFDRPEPNRRVHMEDFAQILGLYPERKYEGNYETLAKLIYSLAGSAGLDAFIHQLVFVILSGNNDAHLKNWSVIYPDGITAELSPAYDLVSTIQYPGQDDTLALKLANSRRWEDVRMESFRRMARKIGFDEGAMAARTQASVEAIMGAWRESKGEFGYTAEARSIIEKHWTRIPLLRESSGNG